MPQQRLSLLGQRDPARQPLEQRAVERGFKPPDRLGQARLRDPSAFAAALKLP